MRNYRDLDVWVKSHKLTLELYRLSRGFPREELYGLTSQLRRAAMSIGANLAEGCGRRTSAELARFVRIAMGSASELDYHLLLCRDFEFLTKDDYVRILQELTRVRKMLWSLLTSIEKQIDVDAAAVTKYRVPSTKG
ncbi:MAG: four helix bundle protein [Acidobacteriia bacterium]|nr:four helix bundle protein [Terriglobia bacterium]